MSALLRLFVAVPLAGAGPLALDDAAARHVQVLRLQPGDPLVLFDGRGGEWHAAVSRMGRREVEVEVGAHLAGDGREMARAVTLAFGVPANDRMDAIVEKAAELGAARIQPLACERSVLRLDARRAETRQQHWQGVAIAASEQCGRTRPPVVAAMRPLREWLASADVARQAASRFVLSLDAAAPPPSHRLLEPSPSPSPTPSPIVALSGPEGGLSADEEALAERSGFVAVSLGPRVLRADTAPLAFLAWLALASLVD